MDLTWVDGVLVLIAIILAEIRCLGLRHPVLRAAVPLYVGCLLGYVVAFWSLGEVWLELSLAGWLSFLGLVCFLLGVGR